MLLALVLLSAAPDRDRLWHYRNLGKAFYENPTTQREAVDQFRKALELAPDSPRERVNLGLALLKAGETKAAVAELQRAEKEDSAIPHTWFNLGLVAKRDGEYSTGITQMEQMVKLVPGDAKAHHALGTLYKLAGRQNDAIAQFENARDLDPNLAGPHFQLYTAYRQAGRAPDAARELAAFQEAKKRQAGTPIAEDMEASNYSEIYETMDPVPANAALPEVRFSDRVLAEEADGITTAGPDLVAWGKQGVALYRDGAKQAALPQLRDVVSVGAGDFDNDGQIDLCVITKTGPILFRRTGVSLAPAEVKLPPGQFQSAIWIDYDHDYDLDLILLGEHPALMRNNGDGTFTDQSAAFPFAPGHATSGSLFAAHLETAARDLLITYSDHNGILYTDRLNGKFEAVPVPLPPNVQNIAVADFNRDALFDVAYRIPSGIGYLENHDGVLRAAQPPQAAAPASLALGEWIRTTLPELNQTVSLGANIAGITADHKLHWFQNETWPKQKFLRVAITGIKNVKTAAGSTVEVKSGALYTKKIYEGAPLFFPLGTRAEADTVRITWPNGLIQNEPKQATGRDVSFPEAQRLSGSCPMIYTWNGAAFQFITDILGVAPLGASSGDGHYFPVDHDEYIQIPAEALAERNGEYQVRITEELREVSYLDQVKLIALDHPRGLDIYTNDKFKSPPFPDFRLFGVEHPLHASAAHDDQGRDVRAALQSLDNQYPTGFDRDFTGVAKLHSLTLDFGSTAAPSNRAALFLNGWVDWADGSTFLGAAQGKNGGLVMPYIQVKDAQGRWRTVVEDMGIPSGKPKTISVDLTGKFLSANREVRIVTSLCVYWDEIFLSEAIAPPPAHLTPLLPFAADLHFRGFSQAVIDRARKRPEQFLYAQVSPVSQWNPTPGNYTRYGDVRELITAIDDKLLVMGSGDEVTLRFPVRTLPSLPSGWRRDFLLLVDGWAKDADANTAFGQSVEPLPFHAMSAYPYRADEHFPDDTAHRSYLNTYQTRPALKLIRPLNTGAVTE